MCFPTGFACRWRKKWESSPSVPPAAGLRVQLVERRSYLGGRASSFLHPGTGEVIDNCQHVLFGCCTNLIDLYTRIGVADKIFWDSCMTMIEPGGPRTALAPLFLR